MNKLLLASSILVLMPAPVMADVPGRDWISREKVMRLMKARGYQVTKMEADDGHWEGDAVRRGAKFEFHVDPHSGAVTKLKRDRD